MSAEASKEQEDLRTRGGTYKRRFTRNSAVIWISIAVLSISCTKTVQIPASQYESIDSDDSKYWRIRTTDGKLYSIKRFTVTDTAIVIQTLSESDASSGQEGAFDHVDRPELPLTLPLEMVESVESVDISKLRTVGLFSIILVPVAIIIVGMAWDV